MVDSMSTVHLVYTRVRIADVPVRGNSFVPWFLDRGVTYNEKDGLIKKVNRMRNWGEDRIHKSNAGSEDTFDPVR